MGLVTCLPIRVNLLHDKMSYITVQDLHQGIKLMQPQHLKLFAKTRRFELAQGTTRVGRPT